VLTILLSLCAAASNAVASVLQRKAARKTASDRAFTLTLLVDLARQGSWLGGIAALIGGFGFQAAALSVGELSLVQPLLALELPLTLLVGSRVFGYAMGGRAWMGIIAMAAGLSVGLFALAPSAGTTAVATSRWLVALGAGVGVTLGLAVVGSLRHPGAARAALLGAATGVGFGITAALMKGATGELAHGPAAVFTSWEVYAMVAAGLASLYLLQNALQSGTLVAAQPAITIADPIAGVGLGVALFHDQVRLGMWVIVQVAALVAILLGSAELAQSPVLERSAESSRS
jgi:hypothetical protein